MPGALNLPYGQLLDPQTRRYKPAAELAAAFEAAGVAADDRVITTCGSGVTACILSLGLYLIGRENWSVYDGSWTEWGAAADTPVEV